MNPALFGVISLGVILGIFIFGFLGVMVHRWNEARVQERERLQKAFERSNLDDAMDVIEEIERVRAIQRELKSAFAKSDLDGGVKAAPRHPLFIEAQARLDALHEQMMGMI